MALRGRLSSLSSRPSGGADARFVTVSPVLWLWSAENGVVCSGQSAAETSFAARHLVDANAPNNACAELSA